MTSQDDMRKRLAALLGYESPSQSSRGFNRLFVASPVGEAEQTRARIAVG
jgi:AraC-like DNA-binding protein